MIEGWLVDVSLGAGKDEPVAVPAGNKNFDDEWDADYSEDGHETDRDWQ